MILEKWEKKSGIGGLEFRDFVRQTWFALGGGPGQLAKLAESLDCKQAELNRQIILMSGFGVGAVLAQAKPPNVPVAVQQTPEVVSILFLDSINESQLPDQAHMEGLLIESCRSFGGIDGVCAAFERMDSEEEH